MMEWGTPSFNELTSSHAELLALLAEESGEVTQAVGKILRHGFDESWPAGGSTNRAKLQDELGHLLTAVDLLAARHQLSWPAIETARIANHRTVHRWLHEQRAGGHHESFT